MGWIERAICPRRQTPGAVRYYTGTSYPESGVLSITILTLLEDQIDGGGPAEWVGRAVHDRRSGHAADAETVLGDNERHRQFALGGPPADGPGEELAEPRNGLGMAGGCS